MPQHIEILHFDDEVDSVNWFPPALFEACHVEYSGNVNRHGKEDVDHGTVESKYSFTLEVTDDHDVQIVYRLIADENAFKKHLERTSAENACCIVLLDLIREAPDGTLKLRGAELYDQIRQVHKIDSKYIFFVTAYPQSLQGHLAVNAPAPAQVIVKPATATRLTAVLIDCIESLRSNSSHQ